MPLSLCWITKAKLCFKLYLKFMVGGLRGDGMDHVVEHVAGDQGLEAGHVIIQSPGMVDHIAMETAQILSDATQMTAVRKHIF